MKQSERLLDDLRALLLDATGRNHIALVRDEMLPLAFPGGEAELDVFCAAHGLSRRREQDGWLLALAPPDAVVERDA